MGQLIAEGRRGMRRETRHADHTETTGTVLAGIDPLVKLNDARRHSSDHHLCVLRGNGTLTTHNDWPELRSSEPG